MGDTFATPIAHQTAGPYPAFTNALVVGRPFRQPLQTAANPASFSRGLELFMSSAGDVANIFCWLDGKLRWERLTLAGTVSVTNGSDTVNGAGTAWDATLEGRTLQVTGTADAFMILRVDSTTRLTLARTFTGTTAAGRTYSVTPSERLALQTEQAGGVTRVRMIEALPHFAFYENVERTAVQTALEALLTNAYAHATTTNVRRNWHRSMRMVVGPGTRTLKAHLDRHLPVAAEVTRLVTDFFSATPAAQLRGGLDVSAGDAIGRAAPFLASDPLPAAAPFDLKTAADADRARRLTFHVQDRCEQTINPVYYLHRFMRQMLLPAADRRITSVTDVVSGAALTHPLAILFPALAAAALPRAREQIAAQSRIPLGRLANFHGHPHTAPVSQREWHYTDDSVFEARARGGGAAVNLGPSPAQQAAVNAFWAAEGATVAPACDALQVPCELMIFFAGAESVNFDPRFTRLEPLRPQNRIGLRAGGVSAALELEYDHATGIGGTVTAVALNANNTSRISVTLNNPRTFRQDFLTRVNSSVLVEDVDRLRVVGHTSSAAAITNYDITVNDLPLAGGFPNGGVQAPAVTRFYSAATRAAGAGTHGAVAHAATRAGTLRHLGVAAAANTLDGATTVTVFLNGAASTLSVTLASGGRNGVNNAATVAVASGDTISVQVQTAGAAGDIRNLTCSLQFAPANHAAVFVLDGFSRSVPNPWNGAAAVRAATSTLTWDQLVTIVDATGGARISPGLTQNLISSAMEAVTRLGLRDHLAAAGLPALPANAGGYLNDWLLHAAHSIFLSGGEIRDSYKSDITFLDLPLVGCAYNTGGYRARAGTPWGLRGPRGGPFDNAYVPRGAPFLNAAATLFSGAPATAASVRFMR
ncbi:hypothetical protein DC522_19150 [Microvirga sp. KLBC 81]|uniref:hypothetical protein n=1 Tax=Microvirga sp. KLBC 81 TaxID=1862707 RepID=UPI000D5203C6|nr:hypothetical protein [Microvirga sp. KLBC 81]PVE22766.1 hypothetical protein DC522_19150 [Microvirga sp. KLBC 81]